jgi:hypothetical protein
MSAPQVSRRSVARGAAWSVPLVAVGVAAPAFAASGSTVNVTSLTVCQCVGQGTKKYALTVTFSNSTATPVTLSDIVVSEVGNTISNQSPAPSTAVDVTAPTTTVTYYFNRQNNGASGTFSIAFTPGSQPRQTYTTPTAIPATIDCASCPA